MSFSVVVITKDGGQRIERLLKWATSRPYVDQILAFVDDTTSDDTFAKCKESGAITEPIRVVNLDAAFAYAHSPERIKTDWALHIGDDELMGKWFDEDVERLMRAPYDVYSFPRYNLVRVHELEEAKQPYLAHISSTPWYPDWCQRLFRPGYLVHSGQIHEGAQVMGRLQMARPHVFHYDFIDQDLKDRKDKWKRYLKQGVVEASRQRGLPDDYYKRWAVPEDFQFDVNLCEEQLS